MHDIAVNISTGNGKKFTVTVYTVVDVPYGPSLKLELRDDVEKDGVEELVKKFIDVVKEVKEFIAEARRNIDEIVSRIRRIDERINVVVVFNPERCLAESLGRVGVRVERA